MTSAASLPVTMRGYVPALTSFGDDANGELYALGYCGGLYVFR